MDTIAKGSNLIAEIDNFNLFYDDFGEGDTPIVFLHGFPFSKAMWQGQINFLKSRHRVIAIDIRGFGRSKNEETTLSIDLFGDDLVMFMDKLAIEKAIICGLSMGGYIALDVLKKFPHRFEAVILCDTQCIADTKEGKEKRYQTIEEITANGSREFNEEFIKSVFHEDTLNTKPELVESLRNVVFSNSDKIITNGLTALAGREETCSMLSGVTIPTLIICGREDKVTPLEQSEIMHASIKGSVLRVIDKAGHVSNLEQPEEFNKYLLDFVTVLEEAKVTE
ncbi:MAG: alpha/beta hydrolase [Candidatus Fluviicola riflensis]|nr:MAG: alpha/beta hydrolase [Candidatus Fluviicola riflensis]OGS79269.1 MAG: alpha/beta hydrolase [Candidatus Fluviicola riflensis]OGS86701.1 MAG: alpha/beta hydrolase [Fluviicola sp. RIFCSPHIGHO2_01_FULL_43_53]OGS88825.1 MAG: alpha/beta hydrolase [Fluviicola sp. RIFCSPHIGHO2_12_FULL_43_24]